METTEKRAHKSIFHRAKSGGNGRKSLEKHQNSSSGPGRDPTALPVAEEAAGTSVQRKGAVQPAGRNATMRLGFAKSAKR